MTGHARLETTPVRSLEGRPLGMSSTLILPELSRLRLLEPGVEPRDRIRRTEASDDRPDYELRGQNERAWIEQEHGWVAAPEEIVTALSQEVFDECQREMTTSRCDLRPAAMLTQEEEGS